MIFLLTHERVVGVRKIETFIGIHTIMRNWSKNKIIRSGILGTNHFNFLPFLKFNSQFFEVLVAQRMPRSLLKGFKTYALKTGIHVDTGIISRSVTIAFLITVFVFVFGSRIYDVCHRCGGQHGSMTRCDVCWKLYIRYLEKETVRKCVRRPVSTFDGEKSHLVPVLHVYLTSPAIIFVF